MTAISAPEVDTRRGERTLPTLGHFINGQFEPFSEADRDVIDPATGSTICRVADAGQATVAKAVEAARRAQLAWRAATPGERAEILLEVAARIADNAEHLASLESQNTGKPLAAARAEVAGSADVLRFMAGAARATQTPASDVYTQGHLSIIRREPVGVVAGIAPWNYPLMMSVWKVAPALAAGNAIVLKPSELTPLTTLLFAQLTRDLLPPGLVNVVLGAGETGAIMSSAPGVDMVSFTGSGASGKVVAAAAAGSVKRLHLELGGKAPVVVFDDADIDAVAAGMRVGAFWNAGQDCGAATRILCDARIADDVINGLRQAASSISVGSPEDGPDVEMGPVISSRQLDRISGFVDRAVVAGATVAVGGTRLDRAGFFYAPTILTELTPGAEILRDEVFGPVITVETFTSEEQAIAMANDGEYGLAASVWTRDLNRALDASRALNAGTVWTNAHLATATEMPWGGFAQSGYGRDLSAFSLDDHSRTKHVMIRLNER